MSNWPLRIALAVSPTGSTWRGNAGLKAKVSSDRTSEWVHAPVTFRAFFGPFAVPALAGNRSELGLDDGSVEIDFEGNYTSTRRAGRC